jgi:hypothetical protein
MMQVGDVLCHVSTCQKPECMQLGRCCATLKDEAEFTGADFDRRTDVAALITQMEAIRRDAERYRWLRDNAPGETHFDHDTGDNYVEINVPFSGFDLPDLDAAVDAAIAAAPAVGAA